LTRGHVLPADKLDRARILRGWSVTELARRSGLGIGTVSRALAGRRVEVETLRRLGLAFMRYPPLPEFRVVLDGEDAGHEPVAAAISDEADGR
jgi:transcriptional regulator with XRE-family HTH domain